MYILNVQSFVYDCENKKGDVKMMRVKRVLALILTLTMVLSLSACGGGGSVSSDSDGNGGTVNKTSKEKKIDFPETALIDQEDVKFVIKSITQKGSSYKLSVYLENNTDRNLMFAVKDAAVNGFMNDPFWAKVVNAGMKSNTTIEFNDIDDSITDVTDVTMMINISDDEDWEADDIVDDTFTIYPLGEDAVKEYTYTAGKKDIVLADNDSCRIVVTGFETDDILGYAMNIYIENKTDKELMFSTDDVSVNGFMCDPFWADSVMPKCRANTQIHWSDTGLKEAGIAKEEIQKITLPFKVSDNEDWGSDDLLSETFEVTVF